MTPVEALKLALNKEKASIALYAKLSNEHPAVKELLFMLLNEEEKHKKLIETKITEIAKY